MSARRVVVLVLGLIMIGVGLFIAARPLVAPGRPFTASRWLDMVFAFFFLLRGAWNVRTALRVPARPMGPRA